jgi:Tfp pilus assembly protein PilF
MSANRDGQSGAPVFKKDATGSLWALRKRRAAKKFANWNGRARRIYSSSRQVPTSIATLFFQNFYSIITKLPWAIAAFTIIALVIRGLTEHVTVIEPIMVPKVLAESGYTQEVAARRLRDAMATFVASANTRMDQPEVALNSELPNVVVPTVGISLDAFMSSMRTLLRITRTQSIAGELTIANKELLLRLRLNGREFYTSTQGGDPEKPDEVLKTAAPEALKKIRPYVVAVSLRNTDPEASLDLANWIISELPEHNENVAWAYNLKGNLLRERRNFPSAEEAYGRALLLGRNSKIKANAHNNLGLLLQDRKELQKAADEYRKAIDLDQNFPTAHYNLGRVLRVLGHNEKAIAAFREADLPLQSSSTWS